MTNTAFLEQWGSKPFYASDVDSFQEEQGDTRLSGKQLIMLWLASKYPLIARCKPPKGQHHAKKYYKAIQPPF